MISKRLKALRAELGIGKRELVSLLPMKLKSYENYESGRREPDSDALQVLAERFNVSVDYLLGVSDCRRVKNEMVGFHCCRG